MYEFQEYCLVPINNGTQTKVYLESSTQLQLLFDFVELSVHLKVVFTLEDVVFRYKAEEKFAYAYCIYL